MCGWATNEFENVQITHTKHRRANDEPGLGVRWADNARRTDGPEYMCIEGRVEPLGRWQEFDKPNPDSIWISTGHLYDWVLDQQN